MLFRHIIRAAAEKELQKANAAGELFVRQKRKGRIYDSSRTNLDGSGNREDENPHVVPGVTTLELDNIMHDYIVNTQEAIPACLNYQGYPKNTCISVNEEVCHGIPGAKHLHKGDIVNIDVTVIKDDFYGDTSRMYIVGGETSPRNKRLCEVTQECLYEAIKAIRPGVDLTVVGDIIQPIAEKNNFSVVRDYCGHGVGREFHQEPEVLHFRNRNHFTLEAGMTFTIEPMINAGTWKCRVNKHNGWTVTTQDGQPSAQYEHTLLVTEDGVEILTYRSEEEGHIDRIIHHA